MAKVGTVYQRTESICAEVEVTEMGTMQRIRVMVHGQPIIVFPLPITADTNEIALRTQNVINQTDLVDNPVRVEVIET